MSKEYRLSEEGQAEIASLEHDLEVMREQNTLYMDYMWEHGESVSTACVIYNAEGIHELEKAITQWYED